MLILIYYYSDDRELIRLLQSVKRQPEGSTEIIFDL